MKVIEEGSITLHLNRLMNRYAVLEKIRPDIKAAYERIGAAFESGGKLLVCGNGGSAADADHIVGELMKGFYKKRSLPANVQETFGEEGLYLQGALTQHSALSTAFLNDVAPYMVFAQQVFGYGSRRDVFLGISTSGNSKNVVSAARVAGAMGMCVLSLTGGEGGMLKELSDVCIAVPADMTPDIQELHLPVYHALCAMLEERFSPGE